jgi:threonine synthase
VPSGNFGNICAGLLAYKSGLPVSHFIAACNANDVVPEYFRSGEYKAKRSVPTISNAMDVGDPSNFVRVMELFGKDFGELSQMISSYSISDEETKAAIREIYTSHNYLTDPHGAVGYAALKQYLKDHPSSKGIFIETAHAVKFQDTVEDLINQKIALPDPLLQLRDQEKRAMRMDVDVEELKGYLLDL